VNPETMQIVIGQRGWVWAGMTRRDGDHLVIRDARVVRIWGTTRGLAQIAAEGPTKDTKLDAPCTVRVHVLAVVGAYDANAEAWAKGAR
jgi:exosome complex RNA-binding protein Rrp4